MRHIQFALIGIAALAPQVSANEFAQPMRGYVEQEVLGWIADPVLIAALRDTNARHRGLAPGDIDALDKAWRSEVDKPRKPTITPVLDNPASAFLQSRVVASGGIISEVFLMDEHGLNVAASGVTSDYWQGDEAKFQETFGKGPGAWHIGDVEFDESAQAYLGQVSFSIRDPDTGAVIGAATVGLNAEMLF